MFFDPHKIRAAAEYLKRHTAERPSVVIIGGSGLVPHRGFLPNGRKIPFARIPHFRRPSVAGHEGLLLCGKIGRHGVWTQIGRTHFYEGLPWEEILFPLRVYRELGVRTVFLTNAAGGLNPGYKAGDFMMLSDHINAMGNNPLIGPNDEKLGPRFPELSKLYDPALRRSASAAARAARLRLHQGVYAAVTGPNYETPAEVRMYKSWGADAVGMSTVPEAIFAYYLGMKVFGVSLISNAKTGPSHTEVLKTAGKAGEGLFRMFETMIRKLPA